MITRIARLLPFVFLLFALQPSSSQAQNSDYSFMQKNYTKRHRAQVFSEAGYTPLLKLSNNTERSYNYFSFLSYTFESKLNLHSIEDRRSISASVPVEVSIEVLDGEYISIVAAPGVYIDYNIGKNATYNNVDLQGWQFSLGGDLEIRPVPFDDITAKPVFAPFFKFGYTTTADYAHKADVYYVVKIGIPSKSDPSVPETPEWRNLRAGFYFNIPITRR